MELYKLIEKYRCIMTLKECPICGKEVDKRGYTQHIRKCKEIQENKESENMETKDDPETVLTGGNTPLVDHPDPGKGELEVKNSKSPNLNKMITSVAGLIAVLIISILMLISPKSKDLTPEKSISRHRKPPLSR